MRNLLTILLLSLFCGIANSQHITEYDQGLETFVDEDNFIRVFSQENMVSYELWDLSRDKRKLSRVINAPAGSKSTNYLIINPVRLKEGEYMIKLIRELDVKKVWFNLPNPKERNKRAFQD
jgi:hypothetical protein